ncbi:polyphosphate polymerase domain-containing protein [Brachybacterium huguangmaarense]
MSGIDDLPPISLRELVEQAELLTRVDRKYLVPTAAVDSLLAALGGAAHVLEIDGRRTSGYRSTYLDTPDLASARAAATGRRRRFKVRRRLYADTGAAFLEVKTPAERGATVKARRGTDAAIDGALTPGESAFVVAALADAGVPVPDVPLEPTLTTTYDRATLLIAQDGARVTIDAGLAWQARSGPDAARHRAWLPGHVVIETKSGTRPGAADRALWSAGHRPVRLSKYATGLTVVHDRTDDARGFDTGLPVGGRTRAVPTNRWHRARRLLVATA